MNVWANINTVLNRQEIANQIKQILLQLDANINNPLFTNGSKKGIYIYGTPGSGKTMFVTNLLTEIGYDIIHYDAGDVRNKALIESISSDNVSNKNVFFSMKQQTKKIAVVMDEIDSINSDKGSMMALIKLIRQKKTKKQKTEKTTINPIICIGNMYVDKKIKELMKVCHVFRLKTPTNEQISALLQQDKQAVKYIQGDLRKLEFVLRMAAHQFKFAPTQLSLQPKYFNDDTRMITSNLIRTYIPLKSHYTSINETDRTIVGLLWHENIVDSFSKTPANRTIPLYFDVLKNTCFADYIDRLTFQNQIWQFNEMSSLIKTFYCNKLVHDASPTLIKVVNDDEIRFTKVLTKYSTEYNNGLFISNMCNYLEMDKKDLMSCFMNMQQKLYNGQKKIFTPAVFNEIEHTINHQEIGRLDVRRMFQFLNKNLKKETVILEDDIGVGEEEDDDLE
jgi:DNA polymerase III delta prime subunit